MPGNKVPSGGYTREVGGYTVRGRYIGDGYIRGGGAGMSRG